MLQARWDSRVNLFANSLLLPAGAADYLTIGRKTKISSFTYTIVFYLPNKLHRKSSNFIESKIAHAFQSNKSVKFLVVLYLKLLSISINFLIIKLGSTAVFGLAQPKVIPAISPSRSITNPPEIRCIEYVQMI